MPDSTELVQPAADAAAAVREPGVFAAIRQAVAGTRASYDYTEGSIGRAIMLLAIPMVLEMLMESVFVVCDVFYVSHITRDAKEAVATVGFTESLMTLVYTLAIGLSIGTMATIARRIGERDREGAARTAAQTIALGLVLSVVLGAVGAALAPRLLALMGADAGVIEKGSSFTRVMLGCNASVVMLILINAVFRGSGDAAVAMRVLWLGNAINILLGPCLIFGLGPFPELGVTGAAIATSIGRGTGALYALSRLLKPGSRVDIHVRHLALDTSLVRRLVQMGWSATLQMLIGMCS